MKIHQKKLKQKEAKRLIKGFIGDLRDNNCTKETHKGLENLLFYFDTVFNDRWWDYSHLLNIIERKLLDMEMNWKFSHYKGWKKDFKNIKKARKLLNLLIKDEFYDKYDTTLIEKYGELKTTSKKNKDETVSMEFTRTKSDMNDLNYQFDYRVGLDKAHKDKVKTEKKFFKLFRLNYGKWWD